MTGPKPIPLSAQTHRLAGRVRVSVTFALAVLVAGFAGFGLAALGAVAMAVIHFFARDVRLARHGRGMVAELAVRNGRLTETLHDLEEKVRLLQLAEAAMHMGHWRLDLTDDSMFWSDETYRIHGLPIGQIPSLADAIDFYHPDDRAIVTSAVDESRITGESYRFRARLIRADGAMRHTEAIAMVEMGEDGSPAAMFGIFADRTDEVELRNELVDARDEARRAASAKSEFLARMSHEIRTPMNGVVGFADLLLRGELPEQQRHHAELIAESGKSLMMLLNDILDLSKIEAGEMSLHVDNVDLPHLARSAIRLVEPAAREKGLHLDLTVADSVPRYIRADALRLRQVVNNLLNNAVKFTDSGFVALSLDCDGDLLEIAVKDTGIGIAEEEQKLVFDAFGQADGPVASERGGTGLGLAICHQLAGLMKGSLTLASQPGMGSRFSLRFPLVKAKVEPESQRTGPKSASTGNWQGRVLLAEDYDINQMLVAAMAEEIGLELDMAENGREAVDMAQAAEAAGTPYALLLMDLQMPQMDGIEAAEALRTGGIGPDRLPIVALTANAFPEDIEKCLAAGMQGHLAKPMTLESFNREIARWLERESAAA
ncbi:PAS domain-containing hybrid sensor histidine kinase/response regulator [Paraurantiacibacter namhicola]|uniref:histidine kinase n=1 Tax=Paraurantiacibacter namhicola TaxID=645517 RepID=A0A1C7D7N8_9SPHN|nr:hybrid sensor histidine kinase/response regulator [Paraurantiacibacter namhicola]ANU07500.1 Autoinducer 2 sensor kinase/phosphatase LuxQ [Paraurantiacibacter namhicola]